MSETALFVEGRSRSRVYEPLGIRADAKAQPEPTDGAKARYWMGHGTFKGTADLWLEGGGRGGEMTKQVEGTVTVAVTDKRVLGILTPELQADPSVWFSIPLAGLRIMASGSIGLLKKRPALLRLGADSWTLEISAVQLILRASGRTQPNREGDLLAALQP